MARLLTFAFFLGACTAPSTPPPAPLAPSLPLTGEIILEPGQTYASSEGPYSLLADDDGNLAVVEDGGRAVWSLRDTGVDVQRIATIVMQQDGNLAAYDVEGRWVWSALNQDPDPMAQLLITRQGALQLVSDARGVLWSSDGGGSEDLGGGSLSDCEPQRGWPQCRALASPQISIYGTAAVSSSALTNVGEIYSDITSRLRASYPTAEFDGYRIYVTNGEPWSDLQGLVPIGTMMVDANGTNRGDELRGGTSPSYLWISEQMICKRGVETRNSAYREGRRDQGDTEVRTFDQVIHEFAHAIDFTYGLRGQIVGMYTPEEAAAFPPEERFAWAVQRWFSSPVGPLSEGEERLMTDLFASSSSFSCLGYQP